MDISGYIIDISVDMYWYLCIFMDICGPQIVDTKRNGNVGISSPQISHDIHESRKTAAYLSPGTAVTACPSFKSQSTWGGGEPCAEQLTWEPVVLEKVKCGGGSCNSTGPWVCPDAPENEKHCTIQDTTRLSYGRDRKFCLHQKRTLTERFIFMDL